MIKEKTMRGGHGLGHLLVWAAVSAGSIVRFILQARSEGIGGWDVCFLVCSDRSAQPVINSGSLY